MTNYNFSKIIQHIGGLFNLKFIKRAGPIQFAGIPPYMVDSIVEHSFKVAVLSYLLADMFSQNDIKVHKEKVVTKAVFHDFAESVIGDVPSGSPSWRSYFKNFDIREAFREAETEAEDVIRRSFKRLGIKKFPPDIKLSKHERGILEIADLWALLLEIILFKFHGIRYEWLHYVWSNTLKRLKDIIEENGYTFLNELPKTLDNLFNSEEWPTNPYLTRPQYQTYKPKK